MLTFLITDVLIGEDEEVLFFFCVFALLFPLNLNTSRISEWLYPAYGK